MIVFVTLAVHRYTHRSVQKRVPGVRRMAYPSLFLRRRLPRATYIFTDLDRLSFFQLELAAHTYRTLRDSGCPVLNDPARVLPRLEMLKALERNGLNRFRAWSATESESVDRFPVFLRTRNAHRGTLTDLLPDKSSLAAALDELIGRGWPITELMVAEYCAEARQDGVFRKLAVFRVGDNIIPVPSVHERHWCSKYGEKGAAGPEGYALDLQTVRDNPWRAHFVKVFDTAGIDYGRADFGIVGGRPQTYEINTNPMIDPPAVHPFADRIAALRLGAERYEAALRAVDTPSGGGVPIDRRKILRHTPRPSRIWPGYLFTP